MESQLGDTTTKCRPFYDTFDASRIFLCRNLVDFINGLWFFIFLTLLLWAIGTPVGLNLITIQTRLNAMQRAQARSKNKQRRSDRSDRDDDRGRRGDSRGRQKQRTTSSAKREQQRERSTSSTARARATRPPLRRTATEETLDIADDDSTPSRQTQQQQQPQHQLRRQESEQRELERERMRDRDREREPRSRERELSRGREMVTINTPVRSRQQLQRDDDNWGSSSAPSRANSNERDSSQSRKNINIWQSRNKVKPPLRRQGTEEFDFEDTQQDSGWRSKNSASPEQQRQPDNRRLQSDNRNQLRAKPKLRGSNVDRSGSELIRRPVTPVLSVNPDIPAAVPMPRTPMRLRNKVSLTARAVQDIINKRSQRLQRTGTDEFDLDESDMYGTGAHLDADAVAAARRTPPRGAPPPPPPPAAGMNRFYQRY
ncbi:GH20901 [Drosophila grimshawi]|uniref:GH20901 n=1 Tax=Drosophila grimshawi TaxID=7222 RepID=B4J4U8_DROGR|nr:GH20901 [Drosophila grimshawi]